MKHLFFLVLVLTTLSSKAKNEKPTNTKDTTEITENNVLYKVYSNNNYIFLSVSTTDKKTSMSILKTGLTVYFDIKGKEKKDVYIKYPLNMEPNQMKQNPDWQNPDKDPVSINLNSIIENLHAEAEYGYHKEKQKFHKDLNSQDISLSYSSSGESLKFSLKIPKSKINMDTTDFSKLSIGVLTNKFDGTKSIRKSNQNQSQQMHNGSGNRRGGGMGGGRGQGKSNQGGSNQNHQPKPKGIEFWFDANLD